MRSILVATSQITGINFKIEGGLINFFGAKGFKLSETSWVINAIGDAMFEVDPSSMMPAIHDCMEGDVNAGNEDKIAMVIMAPRSAVVFYLEGGITLQDLVKVREGYDFIDIPSVVIDGRLVTVRVTENTKYNVATADINGTIL